MPDDQDSCEPLDSRLDERHPVAVPGRYRRGSGIPSDVQLLDLSRAGCRFFDRFGRLRQNSEITIRIGEFGPIVSIIRWRADSYVGVSFEPPLHDAILDYIRTEYPVN